MNLLNTTTAAAYCSLGKPTLERYRITGEGPAFIKIGRKCVRYRKADLDHWLASRVRSSTSDQGEA